LLAARSRARGSRRGGRLKSARSWPLSIASLPERSRQEEARFGRAENPELVGGAGRADVQQMAGFVVLRVGRLADLHQHDVVELQPLHLTHVRHVHAWAEGKLLVGDPAQIGNLALAQTVVVE